MFCTSIARLFVFAAALIFSFSSCSKSKGDTEAAATAATETEQAEAALPVEIWQGSKSPLIVLCGQNYPEESGIADFVLWEYGLARDNPTVSFLYWPRTFEEEDATLRLLTNTARSGNPKIVAAIGAPEGTLYELRRIRNEMPQVKIVSIFPSDDALETEAVSDMVIDMDISHVEASGIGADIAEEEETALDITAREAAALLLGALLSMEEEIDRHKTSAEPGSAPLEAVMRFAVEVAMRADPTFIPPRWQYVQAIDPDTGLRSMRHVLIRQTPPKGAP